MDGWILTLSSRLNNFSTAAYTAVLYWKSAIAAKKKKNNFRALKLCPLWWATPLGPKICYFFCHQQGRYSCAQLTKWAYRGKLSFEYYSRGRRRRRRESMKRMHRSWCRPFLAKKVQVWDQPLLETLELLPVRYKIFFLRILTFDKVV